MALTVYTGRTQFEQARFAPVYSESSDSSSEWSDATEGISGLRRVKIEIFTYDLAPHFTKKDAVDALAGFINDIETQRLTQKSQFDELYTALLEEDSKADLSFKYKVSLTKLSMHEAEARNYITAIKHNNFSVSFTQDPFSASLSDSDSDYDDPEPAEDFYVPNPELKDI